MAIIAELKIPQMFTAYAEDLGYIKDNGLHHYQYFCEECDQVFAAAWGKPPGALGYCERGSHFKCPYCGIEHQNNVAYIKQNEAVPWKVRLVVKEYKSVVIFEITCKTVIFFEYLRLHTGSHKETFRFDIAKQTVTFSCYENGEEIELGNPFNLHLFERSILRFFCANSLANSIQKSDLTWILKILRETVHRKLEAHLKHKISSMFVSAGTHWGSFILPLFNIAYRVACPDAPNLPAAYRSEIRAIWDFWNTKMVEVKKGEPGTLIHTFSGIDYMDAVIAQTRRKKDFITALAAVHDLPDKPAVRRALADEPFNVKMLQMAFYLCQNYDHAIDLFNGLTQHRVIPDSTGIHYRGYLNGCHEELVKFLSVMKDIYGEAGLVRLANEPRDLQTRDCIRLYNQLNDENKKAFAAEKVRLRELHDWLSLRHKKQNHQNVRFSVPAHIVKRLSMQRERLSFFLPEESMQLLEAGHELHNCVGSYGRAMKNHELWIVLVADDRGKLVACLELNGAGTPPNTTRELVQAKVDHNKPASSNALLNQAVIAWAKETNIKIVTTDIKVPKEKKKKIKVPA